ncbi:Zinc/iron permease [Lasiosphaeria miniovina]|uniref:Zinc/iron permease n=1 Tax=Lasiosphaeria miniovina TaxID=1954250 RepID=A0AA40DMG1_9PEZI|nr:Zinc/iron permease [Lasiosphaeria miniovina]KAK0709114.1 Zinc/iron permease [Lasiosphaeria miniovina]
MEDAGGVDNDTRGWIMASVSGIACVVGASIICVDSLVRLIPSKRQFRIQESSMFLACSLSLSFGVMLFSALYSMLPSSMHYLIKGEWDRQMAGFVMMGSFVSGFFGIQIISRLLHQYMPSHVVDCDHTHLDHVDEDHSSSLSHQHSRTSRSRQRSMRRVSSHSATAHPPHMVEVGNTTVTESTPLLATVETDHNAQPDVVAHSHGPSKDTRSRAATQNRRPSVPSHVQHRVMSFVKDTKPNCDEFGPCYGYSDPCGQECFKHITTRSGLSRNPTLLRTATGTTGSLTSLGIYRISRAQSRDSAPGHYDDCDSHTHLAHSDDDSVAAGECLSPMQDDLEAQHHHHVPTNAFLSIGLQTVIAIALHKFPEGFITYATNHASPALGFNVFMALFVHNIAEGFALALPLYMALGSRLKALLWSTLLGGFSQPLGAGAAALWFKLANHSHFDIDNTAYACLFAVTAGIMTSVALQLFVESLSLNHNRNLSIFFGFLGMTILGVSNAIVAD